MIWTGLLATTQYNNEQELHEDEGKTTNLWQESGPVKLALNTHQGTTINS
jgi:hypothetical protein